MDCPIPTTEQIRTPRRGRGKSRRIAPYSWLGVGAGGVGLLAGAALAGGSGLAAAAVTVGCCSVLAVQAGTAARTTAASPEAVRLPVTAVTGVVVA